MEDFPRLKLALVKQVVLPDLYVCATKTDIKEVLFSTIMRIGPLGLFLSNDCDFYIVDVAPDKECQTWKRINQTPIKGKVELLLDLKSKLLNEIPGQEFKSPGSRFPNGHFAVNVHSIDWDLYDIVISINISIPSSIVRKHNNVLWCYMLMEPQIYMDKVHFGYDVSFNHHVTGLTYSKPGIIDFPYTFLHPGLIAGIMQKELNRGSKKRGIFCDISCSKDRPEEKYVSEPPNNLKILEESGHPLLTHQQSIRENCISLFDAKYFIKLGGSYIRGNSLIEAISAGALVIGNPDEIMLKVLLPRECQVFNYNQALDLVHRLERNPNDYLELWYMQKALCQIYVIERPMESLKNIMHYKRKYGPLKEPFSTKIKKVLKKIIS